ncbi:hypothetical protein BG006_005650 [Podila minutissima]|uniref:F-box domain-containing protein n=1 Tax=Podila minutissima TaxID=64525 RepID=A0A9P5SWV0_9FUNG|nr:hypothetical protein BG006_005650 [Podila minutissima]
MSTWATCIPEVLEIVFSFLSQRTLRLVVDRVSKHWRTVNRHCLRHELFWAANHPVDKRQAILDRIECQKLDTEAYKVQALHLFGHDARIYDRPDIKVPYLGADMKMEAWKLLLKALGAEDFDNTKLPSAYNMPPSSSSSILDKVHSCDFGGDLDITVFMPLLPLIAPSLVVLQLEGITRGEQFFLSKILRGCPNLRVLTVIPQESTSHFQSRESIRILSKPEFNTFDSEMLVTADTASSSARPWILKLQTLVLTRLAVPQDFMEAIISRSPYLKELQLVFMKVANAVAGAPRLAWDQHAFLAHVARTCKRLTTFHFSWLGRNLAPTTPAILFGHFSKTVDHWGFSRDDKSPTLLKSLTTTVVLLTSLDVVHGTSTERHWFPALHDFLCNNPHLKHLRAASLIYYAEYMDVKKLATQSSTATDPKYDGRTWACRGLRTLHLEIRFAADGNTAVQCRIIYGYLSRMCPFLEELVLRRPYANFEIQHGLCLLSRLQYLERLELHYQSALNLIPSCFEWMGRKSRGGAPRRGSLQWSSKHISDSFLGSQRLKARKIVAKFGVTGQNVDLHEVDRSCSQDAKFRHLGLMKDLEDLEIERMVRGGDCWPRMERLVFQSPDAVWSATVKAIQSVRSDVVMMFPKIEYSCYGTTR